MGMEDGVEQGRRMHVCMRNMLICRIYVKRCKRCRISIFCQTPQPLILCQLEIQGGRAAQVPIATEYVEVIQYYIQYTVYSIQYTVQNYTDSKFDEKSIPDPSLNSRHYFQRCRQFVVSPTIASIIRKLRKE